MVMNICVAANSKYVKYLYVMMLSALKNKDYSDDLIFYVFQCDFNDKDKENLRDLVSRYAQKVVFIDVDEKRYEDFPSMHRYSREIYFRFEMIDRLPVDVDRALYLDVDVIVRGSLRELYNTELGNLFFAACTNMTQIDLPIRQQKLFHRYDDLRYFNSGVMLWNLKELRKNVKWTDFIKAEEELNYELSLPDQEILNYLFYDKTLYLDPNLYNHMASLYLQDEFQWSEENTAVIVHFAGVSPWSTVPKPSIYELWWKYAADTPFYTELLSEQLKRMEEQRSQNEKTGDLLLHDLLLRMFYLKGTGKIRKVFEQINETIVLYGGGFLGKLFWEIVVQDGVEKRIQTVIDKRGKELDFYNIPVVDGVDKLGSGEYLIILAISYDLDKLRGKIQDEKKDIQVFTLTEILDKATLM